MAYDLGDPVLLTYQHTTPQGNRVNADSMNLVIGTPDGTPEDLDLAPPESPGLYECSYVPTQVGRHTVRWVGTGANPGAYADVFDVRPATPPYLVSLADTKRHLNLDGTEFDEELRSMVEAATATVEDIVGPVVVRTVTEVQTGGPLLVLNSPPVIALQALAAIRTGGSSYQVADVDVDPVTGIVTRLDGLAFNGPLRAIYTAGRPIVPASIAQAGEIIIGHLWETQRGHSVSRPGFGDEDLVPAAAGFMVPRRAMEMLAPFRRAPVVA